REPAAIPAGDDGTAAARARRGPSLRGPLGVPRADADVPVDHRQREGGLRHSQLRRPHDGVRLLHGGGWAGAGLALGVGALPGIGEAGELATRADQVRIGAASRLTPTESEWRSASKNPDRMLLPRRSTTAMRSRRRPRYGPPPPHSSRSPFRARLAHPILLQARVHFRFPLTRRDAASPIPTVPSARGANPTETCVGVRRAS